VAAGKPGTANQTFFLGGNANTGAFFCLTWEWGPCFKEGFASELENLDGYLKANT